MKKLAKTNVMFISAGRRDYFCELKSSDGYITRILYIYCFRWEDKLFSIKFLGLLVTKKKEEEKKKEKNLQAHKLPVQKLYESSL